MVVALPAGDELVQAEHDLDEVGPGGVVVGAEHDDRLGVLRVHASEVVHPRRSSAADHEPGGSEILDVATDFVGDLDWVVCGKNHDRASALAAVRLDEF